MQILLIGMGMIAFSAVGFAWMILASPYSRRCWAVWLLTTAEAMEQRRAAFRDIENERRKREDDMRISYGISPVGPFRRETLELEKRG